MVSIGTSATRLTIVLHFTVTHLRTYPCTVFLSGMLKINSPECTDVATLISLWRHECTRVLADRFTDLKDVAWFNHRVGVNVKEDLGMEVSHFLPSFCLIRITHLT